VVDLDVVTRVRRLYVPSLVAAALAVALAWQGWHAVQAYGPARAIRAGQLHYAGPVVLGFVALVLLAERIWPAQRRPLLARGHLLDFGYLVAYALLTLPLVTLLGAGFADVLERHVHWLVLPDFASVPRWVFVVAGLLVIDATDWLVHYVNHRITALWRLHAVHHSQEELSVLTTFRAHPLVHLSFSLTVVPGFVLAANGATPATLLTAYACLGALPHANVPWSYGRLGRFFISPAYHRIHHRASGRLDVNMGVVFPFWDALAGRAVFPMPLLPTSGAAAPATGLENRPIPVEQGAATASLPRLLLTQWAEPFLR
jgi:sterol desaturase/sphingolipid hydroxylase (fatty acid hydroxylase superfamily)